jgi:hypothetical protein
MAYLVFHLLYDQCRPTSTLIKILGVPDFQPLYVFGYIDGVGRSQLVGSRHHKKGVPQ